MIRRTFDPALLNNVVNHPEVRPWVGPGDEPLDLTAFVCDPDNFALVTEGGGFLLHNHGQGIYEVHTQFLPEHRTKTREAMRSGFDYMFTRTDCERVVTQVPDNNRPAQALAKAAGFRPMFRREDGLLGPTEYMGLSIDEWAQANAELEADGEWFHDRISTAMKAARPGLPDRPEDKAHDRAAGAAVWMIRRNNVAKGVEFYNRWARLAGYTPVSIISLTPPVINVSETGLACIVGLHDQEMEILLCQ